MPNTRRKMNLNLNVDPYLKAQAHWRSNRGDVHFLIKRLKRKEQKVKKEKLIYVTAAISFLIVSGIIISF